LGRHEAGQKFPSSSKHPNPLKTGLSLCVSAPLR
jgi:hypothetical protein